MAIHVLLDTNIYGKIIEDKRSGDYIAAKIATDDKVVVRNFRLIREELKKAPNILHLYDKISRGKVILSNDKRIQKLADKYYKEFKESGRIKKKIINDLKIVACASIINCDLVFSDDGMMKSGLMNSIYKKINLKEGYRTPSFYSYEELKERYF